MTPATRTALVAILATDASITPAERAAILDACDGRTATPESTNDADSVVPRREAAKLLGVTPATITRYARLGIVQRVCFGAGRQRASGFSRKSIRAAIERGGAPALVAG